MAFSRTKMLGSGLMCAISVCAAALLWRPASANAAEEGELTCTFDAGQVLTFEGGTFSQESAAALSFGIANVDLQRQTAELITNKGKGELRVVQAINANHFLEVVNEGFLNVTTVYEQPYNSGKLPAVHSRHFGVIGQPVVAQYTGSCVRTRS